MGGGYNPSHSPGAPGSPGGGGLHYSPSEHSPYSSTGANDTHEFQVNSLIRLGEFYKSSLAGLQNHR